MAQTFQTETTPPASESPQGGIGNPTTILLLLLAVAIFWWSMRRRRQFEDRVRTRQREETMASAEQSARDVAHIMRAPASHAAAAAAASEGLASAARMPAPRVTDAGAETEPRQPADLEDVAAAARAQAEDEERARVIERAAAIREAERTAAQEMHSAMRQAEIAAEAETRRMAAAEAAATEARADTADALRAAMRDLDREADAPLGAVAGDGTSACPPDFPIKGNAQSKIYHAPEQVSYAQTVAEFCFASAESAAAAGFRQSRARERRAQS